MRVPVVASIEDRSACPIRIVANRDQLEAADPLGGQRIVGKPRGQSARSRPRYLCSSGGGVSALAAGWAKRSSRTTVNEGGEVALEESLVQP